MHRIIPAIFFCFLAVAVSAQKKMVTGGVQYKPIFPVAFLGTGAQKFSDAGINYELALKGGFNAGAVIRKGFTELLNLETGLSYVKRQYHLEVTEGTHTEGSDFRMIGYEIPVSLLVYIRLGEQLFMNASMGVSPDVFASSVQSFGEDHRSLTVRVHVVQPAVLANLGWEYRTTKSGYFYLGASFHRPFNNIFLTEIRYKEFEKVHQELSGAYLTFDIRYFFPQSAKK